VWGEKAKDIENRVVSSRKQGPTQKQTKKNGQNTATSERSKYLNRNVDGDRRRPIGALKANYFRRKKKESQEQNNGKGKGTKESS